MSEWGKTIQVPVTVRLTDGSELTGSIHLLGRVPHRLGSETPVEFMNRPDGFFALLEGQGTGEGGGGAVRLVGKEQVVYLQCDLELFPPEEGDPRRRRVELDVVLAGSTNLTMHGEIHLEYHPTRPRALDFLNSPEHFFPLYQPDCACLINRRFTKLVRPQD